MRIFHRRCWRRFALISSIGWHCHGRAWWLCVLPRRLESGTRVVAFYPVLPLQLSSYSRITSLYIFFSPWAKEIAFQVGLPLGPQTSFSRVLVSICFIFAPQIAK